MDTSPKNIAMSLVYYYTPSIVGYIAAVSLAIHHYFVHKDKSNPENWKAQGESCSYICYLQKSDVSNHETWIVALLVLATTWLVSMQTCPCLLQ